MREPNHSSKEIAMHKHYSDHDIRDIQHWIDTDGQSPNVPLPHHEFHM